MDSNRDDAERCLSLAADAFKAGDLARAGRLHAKSVRMYSADRKLTAAQAALARKISAATPEPEREASSEMIAVVRRVTSATDHYSVLGLEKTATDADIRKSFRKLALALHPDKNVASGAEDAFKKVSTASQVLSDADRRRTYDQFGVDDPAEAGGGFGGFGGFGGGDGASNGGPASRNARRRKQRQTQQQRRQPGRGPNLEDELDDLMANLSPEEVFEFLFSAAGPSGARGPGRDGGNLFHFSMFDGTGGRPAMHQQQQHAGDLREESLWTRYKPLTLLATLFFMLMLLSGGSSQPQYSLSPAPSLNIKGSTTCGVDFYVSRYFSLDDPRKLGVLHDTVNRAAVEVFAEACEVERARLYELRRMSNTWLARESTRQRYAVMARNYKLPNCNNATELVDRMRVERERQRERSRGTRRGGSRI
jgi:DnaJ homolog subfamily B member 12